MNRPLYLFLAFLLFTLSLKAQIPTNLIQDTGSVGIGTRSPQATLDVYSSGFNVKSTILGHLLEGAPYTYLAVRAINTQPINTPSFSIEHYFYDSLNSAIYFNRGISTTGGFLTFATNRGTEQMRLDASGNLSIGTTNPNGYRLAVNGSGIFASVTVKPYANWPDYVLNGEYKLPALDSVARYIARYNHLPGIPSAAQVQQGGQDLGDLQRRQMQKIEELTRYAIEADKKTRQQDTTISQLQQEVTGLRQAVEQLTQLIKSAH